MSYIIVSWITCRKFSIICSAFDMLSSFVAWENTLCVISNCYILLSLCAIYSRVKYSSKLSFVVSSPCGNFSLKDLLLNVCFVLLLHILLLPFFFYILYFLHIFFRVHSTTSFHFTHIFLKTLEDNLEIESMIISWKQAWQMVIKFLIACYTYRKHTKNICMLVDILINLI